MRWFSLLPYKNLLTVGLPTRKAHPYHMVDRSPWPILTAVSIMFMAFGLVSWLHEMPIYLLVWGLLQLLACLSCWWRDIVIESTFQGHHTKKVQENIKVGFILFIVSEVMFFFSFFWAWLHSGLAPAIQIGCIWPPVGINPPNPFHIPLLNTVVLVGSGVVLTWSHAALTSRFRRESMIALALTCAMGLYFMGLQGYEYYIMPFTIADSVYGSCFYMMTGFHGLHVLVGVIFLLVCLFRMGRHHFSPGHHVGFECAIWYWHFVDAIWILLYILVYIWPSSAIWQ